MSMPATKKRPAGGPDPFVSVRASAGTGKTHALTTRMIRLLADGAEVSDVFAATFARKAAGEILGRSQPAVSNALHRLRMILKDGGRLSCRRWTAGVWRRPCAMPAPKRLARRT